MKIEYYLPDQILTNQELSDEFPSWSVDKIAEKTGISSRHISKKDEYSSDLATEAARKLIEKYGINREDIDFLIICTQSPDFFMPTTASIVHENLGLEKTTGATDFNLGCSGYVYGLGMAKSLIDSKLANNVLLITVDQYSKFLNPMDRSVRTIFGDGASATYIQGKLDADRLNGFVYGTDGSGAKSLIVPRGGLRNGSSISPNSTASARDLQSNGYDLYMDGPAIFNFTLKIVPQTLENVLEKSGLIFEQIDLFVFHQANKFMLEHLREKIGIPEDKFFISMSETGNTVSSTIPIALSNALDSGKIRDGDKILILGFGVGLSWAGAVMEWSN